MDLREYEHLKFALAAVLQQIPSPETHERRERLRGWRRIASTWSSSAASAAARPR
jgi:hypothetical protein